ncbi:SDR family oxidoreductase [Thalassovita taeanensis]|uniref:NAD(P)-dependent dehydrogenase, short-chain alcohol dehydrogenase family n=1 Tax=Thalassovita taeanensis TaxID=657014 RepID=A0A1H9BAA4_9RHOB|nr:SDR family oxidoreductase [Thalassovita taeanensis]SEP85755.1 NAD(P)-dependent dehydrogenase, short-chain alcohol dehydrogenase family [Thalassovita taeanensis]
MNNDTSNQLFSLRDKVAIITGSSRGIGLAIAEQMAKAGAKVVISSRKADSCAAAVEKINSDIDEDRAIAIPANISDKASLENLVARTVQKWGRVDILVCNAASNPYFGPMSGINDDQFRKILENNVIANHWLVQMVAPYMIKAKDGAIIIVSSIGGLAGSPVIGAYNISKAADMQLARNLAVEFGGSNIRVNCIAPGLIKTAFAKALWDDPKSYQTYVEKTPLARIGQPDEIAGAAVFLAAKAGAFVTGQTIVVDGGTTITGI